MHTGSHGRTGLSQPRRKRARRLGCGARTATRSLALLCGAKRHERKPQVRSKRSGSCVICDPLLQRLLHPGVAAPRDGVRNKALRSRRVRPGVTPGALGRTHPLALPLVALGPNGQLLERRGVSKRRKRKPRAHARRTSVTRMTNTCATQRCVLLVKRKLPSSWRAGGRVRREVSSGCPNPEARGKAESRATTATKAPRLVATQRGAARLKITAHARLLQALARRSFGRSFVRLPPALRAAVRRVSARAAARRPSAACVRAWRAGRKAGG